MRRILLLTVLLLGLARIASAQSTTTTAAPTTTTTAAPTTTTTTLPPPVARCVVDADATVVNRLYHAVGHCTFTGDYTTNGVPLGVPNTIKQAGAKLCNSFARVPVVVIMQQKGVAGATLVTPEYNHLNSDPRIKLFGSGGVEVSGGTALGDDAAFNIVFRSDCR